VLARIRAVLRTRELIHQIEHREARIRISDEIAQRVLRFASGLRGPLLDLMSEAEKLAPACETASPFLERTREETKRALAELDSLDAAVESLRAEADSLKKAETALPTIKTRFRGRLEQ